jgi:hypothetical protein
MLGHLSYLVGERFWHWKVSTTVHIREYMRFELGFKWQVAGLSDFELSEDPSRTHFGISREFIWIPDSYAAHQKLGSWRERPQASAQLPILCQSCESFATGKEVGAEASGAAAD